MVSESTDVTVLGLGEMGSALARAFVDAGHAVTVWNRTAAKSATLVERGARLAPDATSAVAASPVTVLCLSNYAAAREVLARSDVAGRTVVQLGTGTPGDARDADAWTRGQGGSYLDGGIAAWPRQVGTPDAGIFLAGPSDEYARHADLLAALGTVSHVGEPIGNAAALAAAVLAYLAGRWIGFAHGTLICKAEGIDVDAFGEMVASLGAILAEDDRHMGDVVAHGRFANPESTLRTAAADIADLERHALDAGIGRDFPAFAADVFRRGVDAGFGAEEHVAIVKVLAAPAA